IIFDLRPMAIDDLGLAPAVRGLVAELATRVGLNTRLVVEGAERRLDQVIEIAAFRIIQEALNNVWRHAGTLEAELLLRFGTDELEIQVTDEGCGFDPRAALTHTSAGHFGLVNIRERADLLQGTFHLNSEAGRGTTLRVVLPLELRRCREGDASVVDELDDSGCRCR
ncbi:MAG TPA: ATP-binding protein, partial [Bacillota bacterium]